MDTETTDTPTSRSSLKSNSAENRRDRVRVSRRSSHSHRKRTKLIYGLWTTVGILFLLLLFVSVKLSMYAKEVTELNMIEKKQSRELEQMRPKLDQLKKEIDELVMGRLPSLHKLEFDKVIPIKEKYVRNIIFTLIGHEQDRNYEYKMTLKNDTLTAIHPIVKILFFDRLGIQVGSSSIGLDENGMPTLDVLDRGEVRSYTSVVKLSDGRRAEYFMIQVDLPEYQKVSQDRPFHLVYSGQR